MMETFAVQHQGGGIPMNVIMHIPAFAAAWLLATMSGIPMNLTFVCGLLLSICVGALGMLINSPKRQIGYAALSALCLWMPQWSVFIPVLAADATYASGLSEAQPRWRRYVGATPLIILVLLMALQPTAQWHEMMHDPTLLDMIWLVLLWGLAAGMVSYALARRTSQGDRMRMTADVQRERLRLSRANLNDMQTARAADMQRARMAERTRIAREIHDNVGHLLTSAIMMVQADQVVAATMGDDEHAQSFARVGATLDDAMTTIRRSVHDLRDEGTDFTAMVDDAVGVAADAALDVQLHNSVEHAPSQVAHCFAAIIRESLTNTIRHGTARHASVRINELPGLWQLVVQDDGGPSVGEHGDGTPGIGLLDIEERARVLGGQSLCGPHGEGWRVFVSIPKTTVSP
ncbi:sensor histidine kinase [Bifidobacterium gallicum]|nr:histidine kinase [Bifidobacterium gallicum]